MHKLTIKGVLLVKSGRTRPDVLQAILTLITALVVMSSAWAANPIKDAPVDEADRIEAEIVSGIKIMTSIDDIIAIRDRIVRLQKFEQSYPPEQSWRCQMTIAIKQDIEKAVALDSEAKRLPLFDGLRSLSRSMERLRVSQNADALKAVEGAQVDLAKVWGEDSFVCVMALEARIDTLIRLGRIADAQTAIDQLTAVRARHYDPGHPVMAACGDFAGRLALEKKDWKQAEERFSASLAMRSKSMGIGHPTTITARLGLIRATAGMDKFESASKQLITFGDDWARLLDTSNELRIDFFPVAIDVHRGAGRLADAQGCQENLVAALMKKMPRGHPRLRQEVMSLRVMLVEQSKWDLVKQLDAFWQPATQPTAGQPGG